VLPPPRNGWGEVVFRRKACFAEFKIQNSKFKIETPPSFGHLPSIRGGVCKEKTALQNLRKKGGAAAEG
jgi:hypothetical protein